MATGSPTEVLVRIEIEKYDVCKYEWSEEYGCLVLDRMLHGSEHYRFNYGEILNTLGGDGDALDAVVLTEPKLFPTSICKCRVIGLLETTDEKGRDEKLIVIPTGDPDMEYAKDISDVSEGTQNKIKSFFSSYKALEKDKFVKVGEFRGREEAEALVKASMVKS